MSLPDRGRVHSIDIARGIIMVIMALDHVRDYLHRDAFVFSPTNLERTSIALFFTRWITHFCAPTFVFLAGLSIAISAQRKSKKELSAFLVSRGLWLIVMDLTVMRFVYIFNLYYDITFLSVFWMIGFCMIGMAALIHLPSRWVWAIGLVVLFAFNSLDGITVPSDQPFFPLWLIFMRAGFLPITPQFALIAPYAIVPWLSIMMLGFGLDWFYQPSFDPSRRRKWLAIFGVSAIVLFILLRAVNLYGDPAPWSPQKKEWFTLLSFLNVTKYPVSLQFVLLTIGFLFLLLMILEKKETKLLSPFHVIGRVPFFYFVVHFFLAHTIALVVTLWLTGKSLTEIDFHFSKTFGGITAGIGVSLGWVYVAWMAVVVMMYFLCKRYDHFKNTHSSKWLSYL